MPKDKTIKHECHQQKYAYKINKLINKLANPKLTSHDAHTVCEQIYKDCDRLTPTIVSDFLRKLYFIYKDRWISSQVFKDDERHIRIIFEAHAIKSSYTEELSTRMLHFCCFSAWLVTPLHKLSRHLISKLLKRFCVLANEESKRKPIDVYHIKNFLGGLSEIVEKRPELACFINPTDFRFLITLMARSIENAPLDFFVNQHNNLSGLSTFFNDLYTISAYQAALIQALRPSDLTAFIANLYENFYADDINNTAYRLHVLANLYSKIELSQDFIDDFKENNYYNIFNLYRLINNAAKHKEIDIRTKNQLLQSKLYFQKMAQVTLPGFTYLTPSKKDLIARNRITASQGDISHTLARYGVENIQEKLLHDCLFVDIYLLKHSIVIEIDGYVHNSPKKQQKDCFKVHLLKMCGFKVVRINEKEITKARSQNIFGNPLWDLLRAKLEGYLEEPAINTTHQP